MEEVLEIPPPSPLRPGPSIRFSWSTLWPSTEVVGEVPVSHHKAVEAGWIGTAAGNRRRHLEDALVGSTQATNIRGIHRRQTTDSNSTKISTPSVNVRKHILPIFRIGSSNKNDSCSRCALTYCFHHHHREAM